LSLVDVLNRHLRIHQKTYTHTPVDEVVEALAAILGNCRYMKDLNFDPGPLVADPAVAQAWGQERFAHFSTVCATFSKLTEENVQQLSDALAEIQAPLLQQEVAAVAGPDRSGMVIVDIDLTGQKVRGETRQYTGTDFGYIQGGSWPEAIRSQPPSSAGSSSALPSTAFSSPARPTAVPAPACSN